MSEFAQKAKQFREVAEMLDSIERKIATTITVTGRPSSPVAPKVAGAEPQRVVESKTEDGGRVAQLRSFLKENGPMRRKDIIEKSGIPKGTVGLLLKEGAGSVFKASPDHLWQAKQ